MATKNTFQYKETISVNRELFLDILVRNENLSKKDLRVALHLLTHLDSLNFKKITKKQIGLDLNLTKEEVESSIDSLINEGVITFGASASVKKGYKLLF